MDNSSDDKGNDTTTEAVSSPVANEPLDSARRRFTRSAVVSGVVVASLGNRAAWGQGPNATCMSQSILMSFVDAGEQFLSAHPDGQHITSDAEAILTAADNNNTYMDGTKVCIGPAPDGDSLLEGNVGKKGKRSLNANQRRSTLLDGGALDDGPLNGGPRR